MNKDFMITAWPEHLTRAQVCEYLLAVYGIRRKHSTLDKYAQRGGGPKYFRVGATGVAYRRADVDEWARTRVSVPVETTAQLNKESHYA
jgi:predicted DNA-binding transcriptional regulator AlpA